MLYQVHKVFGIEMFIKSSHARFFSVLPFVETHVPVGIH
jgi:hypothetical protein